MSTYSTHPAIIQARKQAEQQKMSITQTFFLAHKARGKLSSEASKPSHDLRLLVLHANFLDQLMLNLSQAEQEEDAWFNNMVRGNNADEEDQKVAQFETIEEEPEIGWLAEDYSDSESDSSDDDDESDFEDDDDALELRSSSDFTLFPATLSQKPSTRNPQIILSSAVEVDPDYDSDEAVEDDENDDGFYALERTTSHRPPSLVDDLSDSDEDDHNPPSPPQPTLAVPVISEKQRKQIVTTSYYDDSSDSLMDPEIYLQRQSSSLIAAY